MSRVVVVRRVARRDIEDARDWYDLHQAGPVFVIVFAVVHASRHPRSWRSRL